VVARWDALREISGVRIYRSLLCVAIALGLAVAITAKAENSWETDYKKAQQTAKAENKLLLINFTGSDWCGYCILFDRNILSKKEFKDFAAKNLVLVEVDFPRPGGVTSKEQSPAVKAQNERLGSEYQVQGFPTVVVLNGDGRKVWRYDGYFDGGPEAFIAQLEKLRKGS
jgi:protein disulfide-isomerase